MGKGYEAYDLSSNGDLNTFMNKKCKGNYRLYIKGCDKIVDIIRNYNLYDCSLWIDEPLVLKDGSQKVYPIIKNIY